MPLRSADRSHRPAASTPAEELIAAIGLEPRHVGTRRHLDSLEDLSGSGIDTPQIALVTFQGGMPELSVDPGYPGNEAVGLDGAKYRSGFRIDLMNLPVPILSHPERSFGPGESRVAAAARRRYRGDHAPCPGIYLLNAILGDLIQIPPVERRSGMRGDLDRAQRLPGRRIERMQPVS